MVQQKHPPLSRSELRFWQAAFLGAEIGALLRHSKHMTPSGAAHLASEYADAAVAELRRAKGRVS